MHQIMNTQCCSENYDNGLVLGNKYIPLEILSQIFIYYTDRNSLLNHQLVCKCWKELIQDYVWRKKAELTNHCILPHDLHWVDYHLMYKKKPFGRNFIKNHSGEFGDHPEWHICQGEGGSRWIVENPPIGAPSIPNDPIFGTTTHCFVTSYIKGTKYQIINLIEEGIPESILDNFQPSIMVSEWYGCRWDCPAMYELVVELMNDNGDCIDFYNFTDKLKGDKQNKWLKTSHVFKEYGKGVRKIKFLHSGRDMSFWAGYYGSKMTRACVIVEPLKQSIVNKSTDDQCEI